MRGDLSSLPCTWICIKINSRVTLTHHSRRRGEKWPKHVCENIALSPTVYCDLSIHVCCVHRPLGKDEHLLRRWTETKNKITSQGTSIKDLPRWRCIPDQDVHPSHWHSSSTEHTYHMFHYYTKYPGNPRQQSQGRFPGGNCKHDMVSVKECWGESFLSLNCCMNLIGSRQLGKKREPVSIWWSKHMNCSMQSPFFTSTQIPVKSCRQVYWFKLEDSQSTFVARKLAFHIEPCALGPFTKSTPLLRLNKVAAESRDFSTRERWIPFSEIVRMDLHRHWIFSRWAYSLALVGGNIRGWFLTHNS
jgi:hypothetical protein